MTQNNNLSVLPFYERLEEQNHRRSYAYGDIYPLYTPQDMLLPFQIVLGYRDRFVNAALFREDGTRYMYLHTELEEGGMKLVPFGSSGYSVLVYPGNMPMGLNLPEGRYYLRIATKDVNSNVAYYYSDIFTVVGDMTPYLKVEWWSEDDLVSDAWRIVYRTDEFRFRNIVYLATELGKPDYEFEEEGETRDGFFFAEKMISEKTYRFQFLAPEYLCDVMRFIRMADYVRITDKYGRVYDCDTFLITPKWETQGNLASVEAEFQTDTVAKAIGRGVAPTDLGDFNDDFNDDFYITD